VSTEPWATEVEALVAVAEEEAFAAGFFAATRRFVVVVPASVDAGAAVFLTDTENLSYGGVWCHQKDNTTMTLSSPC